MTKIYEALDNASKEGAAPSHRRTGMPVSTNLPKGIEAKLLSLFQRVEALLEGRCAIVGFTGAQPGEDSSKIVAEFAKLAAIRLHKRVLLLAAGPMPYVGKLAAGGNQGWEDLLDQNRSVDELIQPMGEGNLHVSQMSRSAASLASVLTSPRIFQTLDALRERYDIIVIDTPPLTAGSDAILLSGIVDGVVIVVQAGKTRWQVIKRWLEQIEAQRGRVLGVILNRRRDFIPGFIYRKL